MTDKGASGAATVVAENLYLRIGKTLSVKERSGPLAQGKGRRAQGKIVIWVVLLPAPSSLLSAFKLPFSFKIIKNEFIITKEFTYCYLINSICFNTYFLFFLKDLPEIP